MKKFLLTILTMIYMTVSSGVAMEIHYCMGERAGFDLYNTADDQCDRCGMKEKKGGCCKDEHHFYKLADEHKNVANDFAVFVSAAIITNQPVYIPVEIPPVASATFINKAPPPGGPPVFIRNCVFRI